MEITLYTLGGAFEMRNVSPFCFKLELLLTHLNLPFDMQVQPDPRKAPKGKLPYIEIDGQVIADSDLITQVLNDATQGKVYAGLTPTQRAYGLGLTRLAEEHLYWLMVASRWLDDDWWPHIVDGFFQIVPKPFRGLAAGAARKQVKKTYDLQGLGRHTFAEQQRFARNDLQALQDAVSDRDFLFTDNPGYFDFAVVSVLTGIYDNRPATWMTTLAEDYTALYDYMLRVQAHVGLFAADHAAEKAKAAAMANPQQPEKISA